jgi:hypothetical protein
VGGRRCLHPGPPLPPGARLPSAGYDPAYCQPPAGLEKAPQLEFKAKKFISGAEHRPEVANVLWWGAYAPEDKARLFSADVRAALANTPST